MTGDLLVATNCDIITGEPMGEILSCQVTTVLHSQDRSIPRLLLRRTGKSLADNDVSRRAAPFRDRIGNTSG
jgi:hypothetical protein